MRDYDGDDDHVSLKGKFWDTQKILLVVVFLAGIIIGGVAVNQLVDPYFASVDSADFNAMVKLTERLDSRNDELYNCLLENDVNPATCG